MFIYKDKKNWFKYIIPIQLNTLCDGMEGLNHTFFYRWLNFGWFKNICD
jgi:hypothetical protein